MIRATTTEGRTQTTSSMVSATRNPRSCTDRKVSNEVITHQQTHLSSPVGVAVLPKPSGDTAWRNTRLRMSGMGNLGMEEENWGAVLMRCLREAKRVERGDETLCMSCAWLSLNSLTSIFCAGMLPIHPVAQIFEQSNTLVLPISYMECVLFFYNCSFKNAKQTLHLSHGQLECN